MVPWSMVSGVRSSCEAVATNARRAASWRRSSSCMRAERAGEVADLVLAGVARHRDVGAPGRDPQRGRAQAAEPAQQRAREQAARAPGDEQADRRRDQQRLADLADGVGDLGQARRATTTPMTSPLRYSGTPIATSSPVRDRDVFSSRIARRAASHAWRGGGPLSESARKPAATSPRAGVSSSSVDSTRPAVWSDSSNASLLSANCRSKLVARLIAVLQPRRAARTAARRFSMLWSRRRCCSGPSTTRRGRAERHGAREHERQQQSPAQAPKPAQARSHASRKR